jgi:hypothetical protein
MYALAWQDIKLKTIISNVGTTLPGNPAIKLRHHIVRQENGDEVTEVSRRVVKRPSMIEDFFRHFSCIDVHDHLRQGSLRLEEAWKTKSWVHRIFSTVFGIIVTDAYYMYVMSQSRAHLKTSAFMDFVEDLAIQLINNTYLSRSRIRNPQETKAEITEVCNSAHQLASLRLISPYKEKCEANAEYRARRRCKVCSELTVWYCIQCSNVSNPDDLHLVCLCTISANTCFTTFHDQHH